MRRGVWLIWLCLALLPLRGMAHATMLAAGAPHGAAAVQLDTSTASPCAMHMSPADGASAESSNTPSCQLCALCHSAALPMAQPVGAERAALEALPLAALRLGSGRLAPDGPFRPPR